LFEVRKEDRIMLSTQEFGDKNYFTPETLNKIKVFVDKVYSDTSFPPAM